MCGACSSGILQPFHRRPSRPFPPVSALPTAGQIGYAICPMIARGAMLGPDQPVILHMLDIEPAKQARRAHTGRLFWGWAAGQQPSLQLPGGQCSLADKQGRRLLMCCRTAAPQALEGVKMELIDAAYPLLAGELD